MGQPRLSKSEQRAWDLLEWLHECSSVGHRVDPYEFRKGFDGVTANQIVDSVRRLESLGLIRRHGTWGQEVRWVSITPGGAALVEDGESWCRPYPHRQSQVNNVSFHGPVGNAAWQQSGVQVQHSQTLDVESLRGLLAEILDGVSDEALRAMGEDIQTELEAASDDEPTDPSWRHRVAERVREFVGAVAIAVGADATVAAGHQAIDLMVAMNGWPTV